MFILIHSPLVGPLTWSRVAIQMQQRGLDVLVPTLMDSPGAEEPCWRQHARSVSEALASIPGEAPLILVAHSGAGPLLPAIREAIPGPVRAYVFVDAGLPRGNATRLELMRSEDPEWARRFQEHLESGGRFPDWDSDDLREILPDADVRQEMIAELQPRALDFFTETIPVFEGWPDAPCAYIKFSAPYERAAEAARSSGWPVYELQAGHFHMLVNPAHVTDLILEAVSQWSQV